MATRSRTVLFLEYRNSQDRPSSSVAYHRDSETAGLIEHSEDVAIEMTSMPPQCAYIADEIDDKLEKVEAMIKELDKKHSKHLLPGFYDRSQEERDIEDLTSSITNEFYEMKRDIQKIHDPNDIITKNVQGGLATKVQEVSSVFRKKQSSYMQKMRGQESRKADILGMDAELSSEAAEFLLDEDTEVQLTQSQLAVMESTTETVEQREREINQIAKSIQQLAEIFRDLQTLVIDQGTMLDRIDYNIEQTVVQVKEAGVQLTQGSRYQNKTRNRKLILLLILIILLLIVILVVKPKHR